MWVGGYTILEDVADSLNNTFFGDVGLPFHQLYSFTKETMERFFWKGQQTLENMEALKNNDTNLWRVIAIDAVEAIDELGRRRGVAVFSTTAFFKIVLLHKPGTLNWIYRYRCSLEIYLCELCYLHGLYRFNNRRFNFPVTSFLFLRVDN